MTNPILRRVVVDDEGEIYDEFLWWCPGCAAWSLEHLGLEQGTHLFHCPPWKFDGNMESPTFQASYLSRETTVSPRCHGFVTAGRIHFLTDSTHELAGQIVDMVPLPDSLAPKTWVQGP